MEHIPVFYFDMDGVLAVFEEDVPKSDVLDPAKRYFRHVPPDDRALRLARALHALGSETCSVHVLTRLFADQSASDKILQDKDKNKWAADRLPWLRLPYGKDAYHCVDTGKGQVLSQVPPGQRLYHVLIDDEPSQLQDWVNAGGTAVQYLQPDRRIERWYGVVIDRDDTVWTALSILGDVMRSIL